MLLDTNVLVRHFTGDPPAQARRATALLTRAERLDVPDLIVAELIYVLDSVYGWHRADIVTAARATVTYPAVRVDSESTLLRALELFETTRLHFADAYLAARAEHGSGTVASFDKALDRIPTVTRAEP